MAHPLLVTQVELPIYGLAEDFTGQFTADVLSAALQAGTDLMLGWFGDAVLLPLVSWGSDVKMHTAAVISYILKSNVGMTPAGAGAGDDNVRARYLDAEAWAKGVGKQQITPVGLVDSGSTGDGAPLFPPVSDDPRGW